MASLIFFLSRRQRDRTSLACGSFVLISTASPNLCGGNVLAMNPGESKLKKTQRALAQIS